MKKKEMLELITAFGNGHFIEEIDNSYEPDPSLAIIMTRIRDEMMYSVKKHPSLSYWNILAEALLKAKDVFDNDESNRILNFEFNLDPSAVGGTEFFTRLGNLLSDYMEEAKHSLTKLNS